MLACSLPKSFMAKVKFLAIVTGALTMFGHQASAQTPVRRVPVQFILPSVTTYYYQPPAVDVAPVPAAVAPAPVVNYAPVYTQPAATYAAPRRSGPPSMSRSSFSERWSANLKVSGRGFRP